MADEDNNTAMNEGGWDGAQVSGDGRKGRLAGAGLGLR